MLDFFERTDEEAYLEAADAQYRYLMELANRSEDGGISFGKSPIELWVGSMYMNSPFLARYGSITETPETFSTLHYGKNTSQVCFIFHRQLALMGVGLKM